MAKTATTTIQISTINNGLLDKVGALMQEQHPELWGSQPPSRNAIVGYIAADFLVREHPRYEK